MNEIRKEFEDLYGIEASTCPDLFGAFIAGRKSGKPTGLLTWRHVGFNDSEDGKWGVSSVSELENDLQRIEDESESDYEIECKEEIKVNGCTIYLDCKTKEDGIKQSIGCISKCQDCGEIPVIKKDDRHITYSCGKLEVDRANLGRCRKNSAITSEGYICDGWLDVNNGWLDVNHE